MSKAQVSLSVRELVEFVLRSGSIDSRYTGADRALEGSRIHRRLQKQAGAGYEAEVAMHGVRTVDDVTYTLDGRADGVITENDGLVIDEIKTTAAPAERLTEDFSTVHWAQAQCYAAFCCDDRGLDAITVQLTYYQIDTEEIIRHRRRYTAGQLEDFLRDTLRKYAKWALMEAQWRSVRNTSLQKLNFPFSQYRAGQYRLAGAVYKTIVEKGRLFACAPTGIGKTISTLFPALKAMGEGCGERIFYLTAKTITRTATQQALSLLRGACTEMRLKSVTLTAKDKVCFLEERNCTPEACPYANGYFDRINDALFDLLQTQDNFTREAITAYAREKLLCPFELALDLTLFCDCILCDYNYLFDPVVNLKRFFAESDRRHIFLVDEAHNLVDRAREMYSATVQKSDFLDAKKALGKRHKKLAGALTKLNNGFIGYRHQCEEAAQNTLTLCKAQEDFAKLAMAFAAQAEIWLEENREDENHAKILQLFFDVRFFLRIFELYDEHFTTLVTCRGSEVRITLLCLDASPFVDASLALGRASVLFSATLTPFAYFMQTLGAGEGAKRILLQSPFEAKNFCLLAADGVSTKYADRSQTLEQVCDMIHAFCSAKRGNYMVFFPSYSYLRAGAELFSEKFPSVPVVLQETGMDEAAREAFLAQFSVGSTDSLVGFCVLGGIFAEGIDLAGDRLIGTVIVGVGLPQLGPTQDAVRSYYDQTLGQGFSYAYQYPGMNKVLQAAGRVIRTAQDKGAVLLIDSRYGRRDYQALFPPHWHHCRRVETADEIETALQAFWQSGDERCL